MGDDEGIGKRRCHQNGTTALQYASERLQDDEGTARRCHSKWNSTSVRQYNIGKLDKYIVRAAVTQNGYAPARP